MGQTGIGEGLHHRGQAIGHQTRHDAEIQSSISEDRLRRRTRLESAIRSATHEDILFLLGTVTDGSLYAGTCSDLAAREARHNSGRGTEYTKNRGPVRFVYHEAFPTRSDACRREAEESNAGGDPRNRASLPTILCYNHHSQLNARSRGTARTGPVVVRGDAHELFKTGSFTAIAVACTIGPAQVGKLLLFPRGYMQKNSFFRAGGISVVPGYRLELKRPLCRGPACLV